MQRHLKIPNIFNTLFVNVTGSLNLTTEKSTEISFLNPTICFFIPAAPLKFMKL